MKKFYTVLSVIALTVLAVGCAKEIDDPDAVREEVVTIDQTTGESIITVTLSVPDCPDTKTTLGTKDGSSYPVLWSAGDVITLNGIAAAEFTPASGNATASAKFFAGKGNAIGYPYNFLYRGESGQSNQVTFPSSQSYVANGFDPAAMPMYASVTDLHSDITFSHVGALLKFSFTGTNKIDAITLTAADASKSLSGTFTIGANGSGILDGSLTPAATGASVTYDFGGHIQLSDDPFVFYVAIPAGTYEGGINLNIVDNASGHMNVTVMDSNATKIIAAGKVREFDNVVYIPAKENNLKQIYNDATFLEFVNAVDGGNKTLNARLTQNAATLSLAAATISAFKSIEGYKGTFDGNNKTISGLTKPLFDDLQGVVKNLTLNSTINTTSTDRYWGIFAKRVIPSLEVDDVPGLQNCTASGSITWTPSSAISEYMSLGGLVGDNKGGTITGCTNNASVTFASSGVTHTNQPSVGGVVGRTQKGGDLKTQGEISNCTNNGTVTVAAQFSQGAYIGGVLGYQVEKAETMSGCVNHGLVKVTSTFSTSGALHLAGVAGMAKGTLENCTNASDGVVTSEACSVSSYLCQGGVVGRLNGSYTYETLTNAGTVNVAALGGSSGRLIGGVVGRCNEGATLDGVTNSGNINYTAEATNDTYIGGVVAHNVQSDIILENCSSTGGTLTVSNASHSGGLYVGGVVGYSTKAVTSCSNAMTIATSGSMTQGSNSYLCFGGVIGYLKEAVLATNCANSGAINFGQTQSSEGQLYIGGIAGAVTDAEIYGGSNSGTITFTGQNTKRPPSVGGIVGRVFSNTTDSGYSLNNNVTNSGSIVFNSTVSSSQFMYAGGLVGQHLGGNIYGTNNAPITVTELYESMMALGGIVGYLAGGTVSNGTNTANGDISVNGYVAGYHSYVGGIVGIASGGSSIAAGGGTITGASNAGDVTIGSGCTIPSNNYVGGVIGYAGNNVSNASNTGNIENNYSQTSSGKDMNIAGVAAHSVATLNSCYNTGNVTNNGSTYKSEINVAGVVGISQGDIISCSNGTNSLAGGTITNTATSGTNSRQDGQFAGVVSNNKGNIDVTSCFNKGDVVNSGACDNVSIAGVAGWTSAGATYTGCYNTGNITNTGTGSNSDAGVRMGGLVATVNGASTFTGNSTTYNYNKGILHEHSETTNIAVGGICGYTYGAASDFAYAKNLPQDGEDVDDIIIEGYTRNKVYVGGIIGESAVTSSFNHSRNEGDILFKSLDISGQVFCGGIIGAWTASGVQTITECVNVGEIWSENYTDLASSSSIDKWSCFGGISGVGCDDNALGSDALKEGTYTADVGGITGKTFTSCTNSGRIYLRLRVPFTVGGVIAFADNDPQYCSCTAEINVVKSGGWTGRRNHCGGIIGYSNSDMTTLTNVTYNGTQVYTTGSSTGAYTGGLIGRPETGVAFSSCKFGGKSLGGGNANPGARLFCNSNNSSAVFTTTSCIVKTNSQYKTSSSATTVTAASDLDLTNCFGPQKSSSSSVSGITVGSI